MLREAKLSGADLHKANLSGAENLTCKQIKYARNWETAYRDPELACGAPIPEPPEESGRQ